MNFYKRLSIAITSAILVLNSVGAIYAKDVVKKNELTKVESAIGEAMQIVLDDYYGDITLEELYEGALDGIVSKLDEYSSYVTKEQLTSFIYTMSGGVIGLGLYIEKKDDGYYVSKIVEDSQAHFAGILVGDKITKIDEVEISMLSYEKIEQLIAGKAQTIKLELLSSGKTLTHEFSKQIMTYSTVGSAIFNQIYDGGNKKIAYIRIDLINEKTSEDFKAIIRYLKEKNVEKIVIDLRNNPGGDLINSIEVCDSIVTEGVIITTLDKKGNKEIFLSKLKNRPFKDMVVLVNANTASAAEVIASALQDSNVKVIGSQTYGKGVIQLLYRLPYNDAIKITIQEYFRRNGESLNEVGIKPDIEIKTPKYITDAKDLDLNNLVDILTTLGFTIRRDSNFNNDLLVSINEFKKAMQLPENGYVDDETAERLNYALYIAISEDDLVLKTAYDFLNESYNLK